MLSYGNFLDMSLLIISNFLSEISDINSYHFSESHTERSADYQTYLESIKNKKSSRNPPFYLNSKTNKHFFRKIKNNFNFIFFNSVHF